MKSSSDEIATLKAQIEDLKAKARPDGPDTTPKSAVSGDDNKRSKEIPLTAFIDAHVGLRGFRIDDIFVAQCDLLQYKRFKHERDKLFGALSLDEALAAVVERNAAIRSANGNLGVLN